MGVLALMLVLGAGATANVYAEENTKSVSELATEARNVAAESGSDLSNKYPGLDKYLNNLAAKCGNNDSSEAREALSEAVEAASLLKGTKQNSKNVTSAQSNKTNVNYGATVAYVSTSTEVESENRTPQTGALTTERLAVNDSAKVATNVAVEVTDKTASKEKENGVAEEATEESLHNDEAEDVVELPNTGDKHKLGAGEMILVSAAVVIATAATAAIVIRAKRD